ncbi:unnamed protein product [Sphenostylis stenocarpa]|uniref:Major facilitator superfamily (MFS) profile domain-containing protein n=1 Tax=Sphenostylis stenocarpa TaxID=92480 RepID=A0AA86SRW5_9FABA|nr:unnamed protein product [Sphenostylis stenocarpa]
MTGCKILMFIGGLFFLVGALLNAFAINIEVLIIGRLLLGFGVGYCNQSIPMYLFEMAPTTIRGALNIGFQMMITIGILIANLINYETSKLEYGFDNNTSLMSLVIIGGVNVVATFVSIFSVDKFGRRMLFLEGDIQILICQLVVGTMIDMKFGVSGEDSFTYGEASLLLFFICAYVATYAWSWGPLGWLVPSEICSFEVRPSGQGTNVAINMFFTFVIAQNFLTMLCHLKFDIFFFFAGFVFIMTIFVALF